MRQKSRTSPGNSECSGLTFGISTTGDYQNRGSFKAADAIKKPQLSGDRRRRPEQEPGAVLVSLSCLLDNVTSWTGPEVTQPIISGLGERRDEIVAKPPPPLAVEDKLRWRRQMHRPKKYTCEAVRVI